jgi:phenylacetate-CoA ligase
MAFECKEHSGLHIITNNAYIEFVDDQGDHVSPGERGEIIVTGLCNHMMPLIRYRIGDLGIPSDERCPCGRSWPILRSIEGRVNDFLILPSGRRISWLHLYRFMYEGAADADACLVHNPLLISQFQLVQEHRDKIVFRVVKGTQYDPGIVDRMRNKIEAELAKQGENLEVTVDVVEEIPPERTGKRRSFISKVNCRDSDYAHMI